QMSNMYCSPTNSKFLSADTALSAPLNSGIIIRLFLEKRGLGT
ncbi:hypothetical protein HMPREF0372_02069, partial [Flavonifractor plautii ATCC 29863]